MVADPSLELDLIQGHAAFAQPAARAFLRVTGSDATRWLNGMVTNAAQALAPGEGNYNFLLNAQGRIQGDCLVFREIAPREIATEQPPSFLLAVDARQAETLQQHLDRFIIMDDVELTPAYTDEASLLLLGPETPQHLNALHLPTLDPLHLAHADTPHGPVLLFTPPAGRVPQIELRATASILAALKAELQVAGLPEISAAALERLRVAEGVPRFGVDIRDRELPQETNQGHALHFAKGCYLGQEIVERIRSRGQVNRLFTGFTLQGALPALPAPLSLEGKPVGELTSAVEVATAAGTSLQALGYLRREALAAPTPFTYDGGTATVRALPRQPANV